MPARKTIFSKPYTRSSIWRQISLYPAQRTMANVALIHLMTQRQLAVFAFDDIALQINSHGAYERQELETFFAWISSVRPEVFRTSTALDLGANIGNHSLFFSDFFEQVHAFEPNERTFKILRLNAELVNNVHCHQVGLSDRVCNASLRVNKANLGASRVVSTQDPSTVEVKLVTLDSVVEGLKDIRLIKVDVEAHDYAALVGAKHTIITHKPIILFEQIEEDSPTGESKTVSLLRTYGYSKFAVIRRYPRAASKLPTVLRAAYAFVGRILRGETMEIELCDRAPEGYQAMVIAIPDWISITPSH
jgi:FkbM family methyltransferase